MSLAGRHLLKFITNYCVYINNELQNVFDPNQVILSDIKNRYAAISNNFYVTINT